MTTTIEYLLHELDSYISLHKFLSVDDPLIVARDGLLLLADHPCSEKVQGWVIEFAQCVLLCVRPIEGAA